MNLKELKNIAQKLCKITSKKIFKGKFYSTNIRSPVGCSGIRKKDNINTLISRADKQMYIYKAKNKNP